jgi:hypothetical protein
MNIQSVEISDISHHGLTIQYFPKNNESYELRCTCVKVDMKKSYFIKTYKITPFYYDTKNVISMTVFNSFLFNGTQNFPLSQDDFKLECELLYLSIGQVRTLFLEECKKAGYNDILFPHQPMDKVLKDLQNGVYSYLN